MTALSPQLVSLTGTAPTYTAAATGDTAPVGSNLVLHVVNGSAVSVTVGAVTAGTYRGIALADAALVLAAGKSGFLPLDRIYRDPESGRIPLTYTATTTVTVAVLQVQ